MRTIVGRVSADLIKGRSEAEKILAGAGNDTVFGGGGDDQIFGGTGNDKLNGDAGNDLVYGETGNDILHGGEGNDRLLGGVGDDFLFGDNGNDTIQGDAGNDKMYGGAGDDNFKDISGADTFDGGVGFDTIDYSAQVTTRGVDVFLDLGIGGRDAAGDKYAGIENVIGSKSNDFLWGNASANTLNGGEGNDYLRGFDGDDLIIGGNGTDLLFGDAGNDTLRIGIGNDIVDGGAGLDWLDFTDSTALNIYFAGGTQPTGPYTPYDPVKFTGDQVFNVEGLRGSSADDYMLYEGAAATVYKFDALDGGAGDDWIGGAGLYYGGDGMDFIVLNGIDPNTNLPYPARQETVHLQLGRGIDGIVNFDDTEGDKLEVSISEFHLASTAAFGAGTTDKLFLTTDSPAATTAGVATFIFESTTGVLWFDADGSSQASAPIAIAKMYTNDVATAADFIFVA